MIKKKTLYSLLVISLLMISVMPVVMADIITGNGISPNINVDTEDFSPLVWMCNHRIVYDDATSPGRISPDGTELIERINNYAFEGEQVEWSVLVMDKNGVENIKSVTGTLGDSLAPGNNHEFGCVENLSHTNGEIIPLSCNARVDNVNITVFNQGIMKYYECIFSVETPESMYGQYWITVEAEDMDDNVDIMDENEYWFLNPVIALSIDGDMTFENAMPEADSYSESILVGNDAYDDSGVLLDMFISGTDFYDSSSSGALCPTTNQLSLSSFRYFATNGAYNTSQDLQVGRTGDGSRTVDSEGYVNIGYGIGFNNPHPFYDGYEIIQANKTGAYYDANVLSPQSEMSIIFKLSLPTPCNGDFDTGSIYFWGEAI